MAGIAEYYRQSASASGGVLPQIAHINRAAIHDHPRIITANEVSSAGLSLQMSVDA